MTDTGTTATQVSPSPVTESEMSTIRGMFDRAANAIVDASNLAAEMAKLRQEFDLLKNDLEYVKSKNRDLDEMLSNVRNQRDTALRERDGARQTVASQHQLLDNANSQIEDNARLIQSLRMDLDQVKADRDQAYDAWHKAEQAKELAEHKLEVFQHTAIDLFGLVPKPPIQAIEDHPVHVTSSGPSTPTMAKVDPLNTDIHTGDDRNNPNDPMPF